MATETPEIEPHEESTATNLPHSAFESYAAEELPSAGVGSAGKDGRLALTFRADADGQTTLTRDLARTPFHVSGTLGHDPLPAAETVYVQSPSGGVVQGDRHDITVTVGPGAVAHVTTAAATKVLSMERNYAAADVSLSVGADGHLDYVPAPTILHPDARYGETTTVALDPTASAVVGSIVVPGRLARGERFDFDRYAESVEIRSDDDLLVSDATHLDPAAADPTVPGVMGAFVVLGTMYVLAPGADTESLLTGLRERLDAATESATDPDDAETDVLAGVTTLPNDAGALIRVLGHRTESVRETLTAGWDEARTALLGAGAPTDRRQ